MTEATAVRIDTTRVNVDVIVNAACRQTWKSGAFP